MGSVMHLQLFYVALVLIGLVVNGLRISGTTLMDVGCILLTLTGMSWQIHCCAMLICVITSVIYTALL